jgi:hypothetical protein
MTPGGVFRSLDEGVFRVGRWVADVAPGVTPGLVAVRDRYVRAYEASTRMRNRIRYDAPPDPHTLVEFSPARVERVAGDARPMYRRAGVVRGGDWDRVDERFEDTDVYRAYEAHFEDGVPWRETDFYARVVDEIAGGRTRWGCESRADFDARCDRLDDLYESIATEGFRSQAALSTDDGGPFGDPPKLPSERRKNEVAVHVDRNGEPLFADGRNRLSIAKLLDLDSIPVRVLRRHADWQATRDAFARGEAVDADPGHPDLPDRGSPGE